MAIDPKVWNLFRFLIIRLLSIASILYVFVKITGVNGFFQIMGVIFTLIIIYASVVSLYRKRLLPPKDPLDYGKWAIITGSCSHVGAEFANYLARKGLNLLLISNNVEQLRQQRNELTELYSVDVEYIEHDFTAIGKSRSEYYDLLNNKCDEMHAKGGIGLLVNNAVVSHEIPMNLEEFSDQNIEDMINCNVHSVVFMTRLVTKYMRKRKNGAVISVSSGSGNHPTPMQTVYSATKAFITQFSRSMHVENWGTGLDFLVVTPYYVGTNNYNRKSGTLMTPIPSDFVHGTFAQLGKQYVWQVHGFWFHGLLGNLAAVYPSSTNRYRKMMKVYTQCVMFVLFYFILQK